MTSYACKVLPVIHVQSPEQVLENVGVTLEEDADGVFLVNHDNNWSHLRDVLDAVREEAPDLWVGVNSLDLYPQDAFGTFPGADAIWVDNAGIDERNDTQPRADAIAAVREGYEGLYFGGVAFKYQRTVYDVVGAAEIAARYMDVVTTSGPATGQAASPKKVKIMKAAIGNHPLAIASGVTPENVETFLPHVDYILCATGISDDFYHLNQDKVRQLIDTVRSYDAEAEN